MELETLNGKAVGGGEPLSPEEMVNVLVEGIAPKGSPLAGDRGPVLNDMAKMFDEQARAAAGERESVEGPEAAEKLEARIAELEAMRASAAAMYEEETGEEWAAG